jgi:hypothetical protein
LAKFYVVLLFIKYIILFLQIIERVFMGFYFPLVPKDEVVAIRQAQGDKVVALRPFDPSTLRHVDKLRVNLAQGKLSSG